MGTTLIVGASANPERYANKAMHMLLEYGHKVVLLNPAIDTIEGHKVYGRLSEIAEPVDSVTLYVNSGRLQSIVEDIIALRPRRVIFNPGTEDSELMERVEASGIEVLQACTLVLLRTEQY